MNKRYLGILIILIGLALLAAIVYFIFFYNFVGNNGAAPASEAGKPQQENPVVGLQNIATTTENERAEITIKESNIQKISSKEVTANDLKIIATSFAERFGSYSNQSNFGNISDLKIFMSSKMKVWADDYVNKAYAAKVDSSIYYGITTKAISSEIKQFDNDAGTAEMLIKTQRMESAGATSNSSNFQQDVIINFVKEGTIWKVDSANWQKK